MASLPVSKGFTHLPMPRGPHQVDWPRVNSQLIQLMFSLSLSGWVHGCFHLSPWIQARTSCSSLLSLVLKIHFWCCVLSWFISLVFSSAISSEPAKWVSWLPAPAYAQVLSWLDTQGLSREYKIRDDFLPMTYWHRVTWDTSFLPCLPSSPALAASSPGW